jgi:hypothetical protein
MQLHIPVLRLHEVLELVTERGACIEQSAHFLPEGDGVEFLGVVLADGLDQLVVDGGADVAFLRLVLGFGTGRGMARGGMSRRGEGIWNGEVKQGMIGNNRGYGMIAGGWNINEEKTTHLDSRQIIRSILHLVLPPSVHPRSPRCRRRTAINSAIRGPINRARAWRCCHRRLQLLIRVRRARRLQFTTRSSH